MCFAVLDYGNLCMPQNPYRYYEQMTISLTDQKTIKNYIRLQQHFTKVHISIWGAIN